MVKSFRGFRQEGRTGSYQQWVGGEGYTQGLDVKREGATHIIPPSIGMKSP